MAPDREGPVDDDVSNLQLPPHLVRRAQHLSVRLLEQEEKLRQARLREAELQRELEAQEEASQCAHMEVLVGRLKLSEAGHAMARAQGGTTVSSQAALATEHQAAKRARDHARERTVQLTLQVELLGAQTGSGPGVALRRAHQRLASLVEQLSAELVQLEDGLQTMRDACAATRKTRASCEANSSGSSSNRPRCLRTTLESRWIQLAVSSGSGSEDRSPSPQAIVDPCTPVDHLVSSDVEVSNCYRNLQESCGILTEILPLLQ